jgi:hypothetical protein
MSPTAVSVGFNFVVGHWNTADKTGRSFISSFRCHNIRLEETFSFQSASKMPSKRLSWVDVALAELERRSRRSPAQYRPMMSLKTRHWSATSGALGGPLARLSKEAAWALPVATSRGACIFLVDRVNTVIYCVDPTGAATDEVKRKACDIAQQYHAIKRLEYHPYRFVTLPCPLRGVRRWHSDRVALFMLEQHLCGESTILSTTLDEVLQAMEDTYPDPYVAKAAAARQTAGLGVASIEEKPRTKGLKKKKVAARKDRNAPTTPPTVSRRRRQRPSMTKPRSLSPILEEPSSTPATPIPTDEEDAYLEGGGGGFSLSPSYRDEPTASEATDDEQGRASEEDTQPSLNDLVATTELLTLEETRECRPTTSRAYELMVEEAVARPPPRPTLLDLLLADEALAPPPALISPLTASPEEVTKGSVMDAVNEDIEVQPMEVQAAPPTSHDHRMDEDGPAAKRARKRGGRNRAKEVLPDGRKIWRKV